MAGPFLIRGEDGAELELTDPAYFLDEYEAKGFRIVQEPTTGYDVPDVRDLKRERAEAAKKAAEKDAKADEKKDA